MVLQAEVLEQRLRDGVKGVTQEMVDDAKAMAEKAGDEYEAVGGVIPERMANGVNIKKGTFTDATKSTVREGIAAGRKEADPSLIGEFLVEGMSTGVRNRTSSFREAMRDVIRAGITAAKVEAEIKSPSRKMRDEVGFQIGKGAELGITDATAGIKAAVVNQMRAVQDTYNRRAVMPRFGDVLGGIQSGFSSLRTMRDERVTSSSSVINVYPQNLTPAQIDYLVAKVNLALGSVV